MNINVNVPLYPQQAAGPRSPLKILHVVRQFYPNRGGLEDFVANLGREQVRMGCDVRVLTCDRLFARPDERLPATGHLDGMAIRRLPFYGSTRYPIVPALLRNLGDADIVHVHGIDSFFDALAMTQVLHRKPLVATTHGGFFHTQDHARLKALWFQGPTRLAARAYGAIVGCSENDVLQFSRIAGDKVRKIENGVDLLKFGGMASPVSLKSIVAIGRFSKNKRLDRMISAIAELTRRDPDWHLHIVGASSDWTAADLQDLVDAAGVIGNVTIHTDLPDRAVADLLKRTSFFASASEFEGFGISLIEAMSAGLVPIVHPNASFKTLAARHSAIHLADFSDPLVVADAIESAWRHRMDVSATDLSQYAWSTVAARYQSVYAALR